MSFCAGDLQTNLANQITAILDDFWREVLDSQLPNWAELEKGELERRVFIVTRNPKDSTRTVCIDGVAVAWYQDPVPDIVDMTITIKFNSHIIKKEADHNNDR